MILKDKILTILQDLKTQGIINTVMYDSAFSANVRIDRSPMPAALLYLLEDWNLDLSKSAVKESANLQVFFFDTCSLDIKGEEKDVIVNAMEAIARQFISVLLEDKSIVLLDDKIRIQSTYGKFDKFCVGVTLNLKIEQKQGECL